MVEEMITMVDVLSNIVWAVALIEGVLAAILLYLGYRGLQRVYGEPAVTVKYHCPNCGNTYYADPDKDACIICGQKKSVKIKE